MPCASGLTWILHYMVDCEINFNQISPLAFLWVQDSVLKSGITILKLLRVYVILVLICNSLKVWLLLPQQLKKS